MIRKKKRVKEIIKPIEFTIKIGILFSYFFLKINTAGIKSKLMKKVKGKDSNPKPIGPPVVYI